MLMQATGEPVTAVGASFVVHMDREALNDYPMGLYDARSGTNVVIVTAVADRRRHARHVVLRLVVYRSGLERRGDLPGPVRRGVASHSRDPRPNGGTGRS